MPLKKTEKKIGNGDLLLGKETWMAKNNSKKHHQKWHEDWQHNRCQVD